MDMAAIPDHPVAGDGASDKEAMPQQPQMKAVSSPRSLSGDPQRSTCSDGAAGSGKDCSCQRKKRRHPVARVKGNWLPDEDEKLRQLVKTEGEGQWSVIAKSFPGRIGKQCRERWHNQLRPDIKREAWTDAEETILITCHIKLGNKWADIAKELSGRTENAVKNHWNATLRRRDSDQGGATKLKEYMRGLNMQPNKRKRKASDDAPRSPATHEHSPGRAPPPSGARKRLASAGETPCSHARKQPLFMEQLLKAEPHDDDAIPLYDYSFSAASNAAPHKGGDTIEVLMPTATSARRQLQPMMPAQGSTISDTTHFTGGQVLLASSTITHLGCPEHLNEMGRMQNVTPPTKRPPLPRLDIPCAPSGAHVPASTAHNAALTPRGRIDGLGWVKQGEDENLENALNALAYPDSDAALLTHQGGSLVSPALFSSMGASLGISPFQQALLNFTPGGNGHSTPRSHDGYGLRTPLGFIGPPAALNIPPQWALQDMSSASVRPPRTTSAIDPAAMGAVPSPFSPDADAVVREFMASPEPTAACLAPEADLPGSRQEAGSMPAPPTKSAAPANSGNDSIFGQGIEADLLGGPYACTAADAAAAIGFDLGPVLTQGNRNGPHRCPASLAPMWEGEQVAESPYQQFMQEFANEGVQPVEPTPGVIILKTKAMERTSSDHSASAPSPADIQNMIRSMWSCEGPPQESPKGAPKFRRDIHSAEGSSIMAAALPSPAAPSAKNGRRTKTGAMKADHTNKALPSPPSRQLRSRVRTPRATV